jgi:hypothetical protein
MQFAEVKNDIAFRKIFGNEQKTAPLISFLNAALELEGDNRVVSVSIATARKTLRPMRNGRHSPDWQKPGYFPSALSS